MKQLVARAIVLGRTDYGEADRILTLLTPNYGKLSLLAKGVRRVKSKLAGGIELFSVSEITFIRGRRTVGTLVSARLVRYYEHIVKNLDRTMFGYDLLKQLNKATADEPEEAYFVLMQQVFEALDDAAVPLAIIRLWFAAQMQRLGGHTPNLQTDIHGNRLILGGLYDFDFEHMAFLPATGQAPYTAHHIKFLRLAYDGYPPKTLSQIQDSDRLVACCTVLARTIQQTVQ